MDMFKFKKDKKAKRYEQMRERRRTKFRKRLESIRPLLLFLQQSKKATVDALVGVGKKYGILRYPVIAVLAVFLFIYHLFYQTMVRIKLQEKLARGMAFILTLCMVVTGANVTAFAVGSTANENGQTAQILTCDKEEHIHTDACYEKQLICDLEEDHVHTDSCYETKQVLDCQNTDADHMHTAACYKTEKTLICGQEEGHRHTDACYEKILTCGKEEHTHTDVCYAQSEDENDDAIATQSAEGVSVQAEDAVTFANNAYPYGKSMSYPKITLVAELESGTAKHVEWQYSQDRSFATYEVLSNQTELTTRAFTPEDGMWYRCVVNYNYKTKAIQAAMTNGSVITNPTSSKTAWYLTNGDIAYTAGSLAFDVIGRYEKEGKSYWLQTSYSTNGWAIHTSKDAAPAAIVAEDYKLGGGDGGLSKLRVAFISGERYGLDMEAFLQDGKQSFAFGCDTMLGNSDTSGAYSDQASLKAIKNQGTVSQVQMVGAETVSSAKVEDPSFVVKFNSSTPPTYYWLGHRMERKWWGQGSCDDYNSTNHTQYDEKERNAADSGMTMSWCNVAAGTGIKFSFYAGSVENTGAVIKANAKVSSTEITLTGLKTDYEYQLVDESGNPVGDWQSANADGTLTYTGLTPNTKYKVKSRTSASSETTYVDVDATTAVDPTENSSGAGGSSSTTEVTVDYRYIKITNAEPSYSYCLQDEDGYEMTGWVTPTGQDNTVLFEGLNEATTYYLVAKTTDNNKSERREYTTQSRTYTISFDDNGQRDVEGTVPTTQTKTSGNVFVIPTTTLTREGYSFRGWSTDKNATTAEYKAGDIYSADADAKLYAVWYQKVNIELEEDAQSYEYTGYTESFAINAKNSGPTSGYTRTYYQAGTQTKVSSPKEVGSYDVHIARAEDSNYKAYDKTLSSALVITKAMTWTKKPASLGSSPTSFYTTNDSGKNMTDGTITGVTSEMEYRAEGETTYHPIDGTSITNLANGTYYVRYKDNDTHVAGPDATITINGGTQDDTAPTATVQVGTNTWKAFINNISFGLLFQDTVEVSVEADDNGGCGVDSVSYWIATEARSLDDVKANTNWTKTVVSSDGKAKFDVNPSGSKVAYVKVEDKLGNTSYYSTDGMRVYTLNDTFPVQNETELAEAISAGYKNIVITENTQEVSLTGDVTIPADVTLTISQDTGVRIADNANLTNNGKLVNNGRITGGSLTNNATLVNGTSGTIKTPVTNGADGKVSNNNQASWKDASGEYYGSFKDALAASPVAAEIIIDTNTTLPAESITIPSGTKVTMKDGVKVTVPKGGVLTIPAESTITNKGTIAVDQGGQLINQGNLLDGTLINQGTLVNSGITENLVMDNAGIVENSNRIYGGDVTNEGTIKNMGTITNGTLTNQGTIINGSNSNIKSPVANEGKGSVTNKNTASWKDASGNAYYGSLEEALAASPAASEITIECDVTLKAGETTIPDNVIVNISEGAKVTVPNGSSLTLPVNGSVKNKGTIEVEENGQIVNNGSIANNGTITGGSLKNNAIIVNGTSGTIKTAVTNGESGTVSNNNQASWTDASGEHYGSIQDALAATPVATEIVIDKNITLPAESITIPSGTKVTIKNGVKVTVPNDGTLTNNGSIENNGVIVNEGTFINHGTIVNEGQIINNNVWSNDGQITGNGKLIGTDKKTVPENKPETPNNTDTTNTTTDAKDTAKPSSHSAQKTGKENKKAKNTSGSAENTENTLENTTSLVNINYDEEKDKPIRETTKISMGSGNVIVNIASIDENGESGDDTIKGVILTSCKNVIQSCLTEEERKAVENGETIEITLTVQKLKTSVDKTDKKQIEKAMTTMEEQIPGLAVGQYIDISVMKKVGSAEWKKISKLNDEIEICIDVSDELKQDGRTYFIMRNHDGSCYLLDDQDDQADTITVRTGLFSTYAILYTDTAASQWNQAVEQSIDEGAIRGTQNQVCHWHFMILALMLIFIILLYVMRRSSLLIRLLMLLVNAVSGLAFAMVGTCNLDWICFILDMVVSVLAIVLLSRMQQIKDKE